MYDFSNIYYILQYFLFVPCAILISIQFLIKFIRRIIIESEKNLYDFNENYVIISKCDLINRINYDNVKRGNSNSVNKYTNNYNNNNNINNNYNNKINDENENVVINYNVKSTLTYKSDVSNANDLIKNNSVIDSNAKLSKQQNFNSTATSTTSPVATTAAATHHQVSKLKERFERRPAVVTTSTPISSPNQSNNTFGGNDIMLKKIVENTCRIANFSNSNVNNSSSNSVSKFKKFYDEHIENLSKNNKNSFEDITNDSNGMNNHQQQQLLQQQQQQQENHQTNVHMSDNINTGGTDDSDNSGTSRSNHTCDDSLIFQDVHKRSIVSQMKNKFENNKLQLSQQQLMHDANMIKKSKDNQNNRIRNIAPDYFMANGSTGGGVGKSKATKIDVSEVDIDDYAIDDDDIDEDDIEMNHNHENVYQPTMARFRKRNDNQNVVKKRLTRYSISEFYDDPAGQQPAAPVVLRRHQQKQQQQHQQLSQNRLSVSSADDLFRDQTFSKRLSQYSISELLDGIESEELVEELFDEFYANLPQTKRGSHDDKRLNLSLPSDPHQLQQKLNKNKSYSMENLSASTRLNMNQLNRNKYCQSTENLFRKIIVRKSSEFSSRNRPLSVSNENLEEIWNFIRNSKNINSVNTLDDIIRDEVFSRCYSEYSITDLLELDDYGGSSKC